MIWKMQLTHEGVSLIVSELNIDSAVSIVMQDDDNPNYGHFLELDKEDLVILRDWLTKQIERIE